MCGSGLIPGSTLLTTFFPSLSFSSRALPDSIPCIRFKDCSLYMVQRLFPQELPPSLDWGNNMVGGKHILGEEDTAHTLLIGEQLVLGRRTTFKEKIYMVGWVDGWVDGFHPSCTNSQIIRPEEVINWGKIQYFLPIKHFAPTFNHFPPTFNHCAPTNNQFAPSLPPPYIGIRSQKNIRFALLCIPYIGNILMLHPGEI